MHSTQSPSLKKQKKISRQELIANAVDINIRQYVEVLAGAMAEAGLHRTHLSAKPLSSYNFDYKPNGRLYSELTLQVQVDVCAKPPSKKRLLCWLYRLLEDLDGEGPDHLLGGGHLPREWLVHLIEQLSRKCGHKEGGHNEPADQYMGLHLVNDCFDEFPAFALGSSELRALTAGAEQEADLLCCDAINEAMADRILVSRYGLTIATDVLVTHKNDGQKLLEVKQLHMNAAWQQRIKAELFRLANGGDHQPQEEAKEEPAVLPLREQIAAVMHQNLHILAEQSLQLIQKPDADRFPL